MKRILAIAVVLVLMFQPIPAAASGFTSTQMSLVTALLLDQYLHYTTSNNLLVLFPDMSQLNNTVAAAGAPRIDKLIGFSAHTIPRINLTENLLLEGELNWFFGWTQGGGSTNRRDEVSVFNPNLLCLYTFTINPDQLYGNAGIFAGLDMLNWDTKTLTVGQINERSRFSANWVYGIASRWEWGTKLESTLTLDLRYRLSRLPDFTDEFGNVLGGTGTDFNGLGLSLGIHHWF